MTRDMMRAVLAAIAGFVAVGILISFTDQLLSLLIHGFNDTPRASLSYFVISVFTDIFYCFLGGYLCATIAKNMARIAGIIMALGGDLVVVAGVVFLWNTVPHVFGIALIVAYPPAVWAGVRFRMRGETSLAA